MGVVYQKADLGHLSSLVQLRMTYLQEGHVIPEKEQAILQSEVEAYYKKAIKEESHVAYLVFQDRELVGGGGVCFLQVLPTIYNPSGQKAYLMNIYTHPSHRRKGIARKILTLLLEEAKVRNIRVAVLKTTDMGRKMYQDYGFYPLPNEMEYILDEE